MDASELAFYSVCWLDMIPQKDASFIKNLPPGDPVSGKNSDYGKISPMVEFRLPIIVPPKKNIYFRKFYRIESELYVGTFNRTHAAIAEEDGNLSQLRHLIERDSPDADAGSLTIHIPDLSVMAHDSSWTLGVSTKVNQEARRRTGLWLVDLLPESYTIEASVPNIEPVIVFNGRGRQGL